jgi:hypothetical protein
MMLKGWTVLKSFNTAQELIIEEESKRNFLLLPAGDYHDVIINLPERGDGPAVTVTSKKKPMSNLKRRACFFGRIKEVCDVYRFLSDAKKRMLVITGGSKIGKLEVHMHTL